MTAAVTAVVLSWNGRDDTLACLRSLRGEADDVIVVDNASTDGSAEAVAAEFPEAELVRNEENLGYTGGMNVGIRRAFARGADHVLLLNNDVEVEAGAVAALVAEAGGAGAVCPVITFADDPDRVWYAGASFDPRRGYNGRHWGYARSANSFRDVAETQRASGAAMLVPHEAADEIGVFDNRLFAYWEDADWSLRARRAGRPIRVVPTARVRHKVSATTGGEGSPTALYYSVRNMLAVCERHAPLGLVGTLRRRGVILVAHAVQALLRRDRRAGLSAVYAGWRDFRRKRFGRRLWR